MGEVYRATDTNLGRQVAIKVLPEAFAQDADRLARFDREAKTLAALNHPHIAAIYGLEKSDGTTALVMELVEGPTIEERLRAQGSRPDTAEKTVGRVLSDLPHAGSTGPGLQVDEALDIARQIAEALEAAHEQGIIHRDLKPANVKVRPDGTVKVLDFGLAKAMEPAAAMSASASMSPTITTPAMTQAGMILGTAAYMSPEQARGKPVDRRTDIWAFGCVLYEMLTGRRAFEDEDVSMTLSKVLQREPDFEALSEAIPARVRQALRVCLRKDPKHRAGDIRDVRLAMEGAFESPVGATAAPAPVSAPLRLWQRPVPAAIGALALAGVAALAVWVFTPAPARPVARFVASTSPAGPFFRTGNQNQDLAISPDGNRLVYTAGQGIGRFLYVRPIDQLEGTANLGGLPGSDTPFFSPDGAWLGFATASDGSWKKVSILGGPPVTLWDSPIVPRGASWGPDDTIVFAQAAPGTGLFRGPAAGGTPEILTTPDKAQGELNHWWPEFLPGGRAVLFTIVKGSRDQDRAIAVLNLDTGTTTVLVPGGTCPRYVSTGHLLYGAENTLRAVPFDLAWLRVTGDPVPVLEGVMIKPSGAVNVGVSASGTLVYATGRGGEGARRTFVWVDRAGVEQVIPAEPRDYQEFSLSPDGARVAVRVSGADSQDVWVYDLRRNTSTRLTFDPEVGLFPTWTPEGQRLAFGSVAGPLSWKAADGTGEVERLGQTPNQIPQAFTPDGTAVVFEQRGGGSDLGVLSLKGDRSSKPMLDSRFAERNAALSPDGRWLAYDSDESGRTEVYVRPFPEVNAGRWQISTEGGDWPVWNPAGRELFYRGPKGVVAQAFDGVPTFTPRARTQLFEWSFAGGGGVGGTNRRMAVSPDGKRFLLLKDAPQQPGEEAAARPQIIVVENWSEELKRLVPVK